jgi:hypothetical protein
MSTFKKYGYSNAVKNKYQYVSNSEMQQKTGTGKEIFESHLDLSGNSLLHTGCIYFLDGTSMTSSASQEGNIGSQGAQGSQGPTGVQGPGLEGTMGARGAQGNQGNVGSTGYQGAQGNQGEQGYIGHTGNRGSNGTSGSQGNRGATGTASVQGNPRIYQCDGDGTSVALENAIIEFGMSKTEEISGRKIVVLQKINLILNVVVLVQTDDDGSVNEEISISVANMSSNWFEVLISNSGGSDIPREFYYQAIGT